jgi:hypothetical protein
MLDQALQQQAKGEEDLSENWIAEAQATLNGVQRILEAASAESETALRPFKGKGSHFEAVETDMVEKAREAVRSYLLTAEMLSPEEAPLNTLSVAHALGFNRKTLKKYGLDVEIARASERQARNGKISPRDSEGVLTPTNCTNVIPRSRQALRGFGFEGLPSRGKRPAPRNRSDRPLEAASSSRPELAAHADG